MVQQVEDSMTEGNNAGRKREAENSMIEGNNDNVGRKREESSG